MVALLINDWICLDNRTPPARFVVLTGAFLKVVVFWNVMLCHWVSSSQHCKVSWDLQQSKKRKNPSWTVWVLRWRQHGPLKCCELLTPIHRVASQKSSVFKSSTADGFTITFKMSVKMHSLLYPVGTDTSLTGCKYWHSMKITSKSEFCT